MAGYECYACGQERPVTQLQTSLVTGQTLASCNEDLPAALIGALAGALDVDASPLYDSIKRHVDKVAREQAKAEAEAAQLAAAAAEQHRQDDGEDDRGHDMTDQPEPGTGQEDD